jgi:bifunctional enzyme CysN/CysC
MSWEIQKEDMNIVIVGHVDHGKSTIIGRLLAETNSLPQGKLEQIKERCRRNSKPFEYAFLLDALKDEQAQGITIDAARCFFKSVKRDYIIIDAPGHIEFLKNMVTGASRAEAALLVIDANEGVQENSKRHGYLLSMLGIKQVAVLINKIDLINYDQQKFFQLVLEYSRFLEKVGITPACFIPVSGREGDNIAVRSSRTKWYRGKTVLETLDGFDTEKLPEDKPFRMPVQAVYKFTRDGDDRRIVAGTIESGSLRVGDEVVFYPSGKKSIVKTMEAFNRPPQTRAAAGNATGFTLTEQIYIARGEMAALANQPKPKVTSRIKANLFWLGKETMVPGKKYLLKLGTAKIGVELEEVSRVIDAVNLSQNQQKKKIDQNDVAECLFKLDREIAFDLAAQLAQTSRFVIVDNYEISGGGIIQEALETKATWAKPANITWHSGGVTYEDRCRNLRQRGMVVLLTGLSGSGKSTIATELEKQLYKRGNATYILDGDNIRHGLNADLGFSDQEREENIRRIAEMAALFKDAGLITLLSVISPSAKMRNAIRERVGEKDFAEVYVKADVETCAGRDPKGLYQKAKRGEITNFTGISAPYEEPEEPDLVIDTRKLTVRESVDTLLELVIQEQERKQVI